MGEQVLTMLRLEHRSLVALGRRHASTAVKASPAARIIAARHGLDIGAVPATGPKSYVLKSDVLAVVRGDVTPQAATQPVAESSSPAAAATLPALTGNPKAEIPHYYLSVDLKMDPVVTSAKQFGEENEGEFVEALMIKASAAALRAVPLANSAWMDTATRQWNDVNIQCRGSMTEYSIPYADKQPVRTVAAAAGAGTTGAYAATFTVDFLDDLAFARSIVGHGQSCVLTVGQSREETVMSNGQLQTQTVVT